MTFGEDQTTLIVTKSASQLKLVGLLLLVLEMIETLGLHKFEGLIRPIRGALSCQSRRIGLQKPSPSKIPPMISVLE